MRVKNVIVVFLLLSTSTIAVDAQQLPAANQMFTRVNHDVPVPQSDTFIVNDPIECGDGYVLGAKTKERQHHLLSFDTLRCVQLDNKGRGYDGSFRYQMAYDTLRRFIEECPLYPGGYSNFSTIGSNAYEVVKAGNETAEGYRMWLKKVLYYNPDSLWYCSDANEFLKSYLFDVDGKKHYDAEACITVVKFLIDSAPCSIFLESGLYSEWWNGVRKHQEINWRDTVQDSIQTPFDTTGMKTLEELDLTILRGTLGVSESPKVTRFGTLNVRRNPFTDVIELRYELLHDTWSRVEVYDLLGRTVHAESTGFQPKGKHSMAIDGRQWSSGTYYVRLSSVGGEVKTIKLIKE